MGKIFKKKKINDETILDKDFNGDEIKSPKKKWKDKTDKEKVLTVLLGTKKAIGIIIRFFAKLFLVLFVLLFVGGCLAGGYIFSQVWPHVEQYKEVAYEKFDEIGPNTFTHLGDTVIYDKAGNIISEINVSNFEYVEIENVSKWISEGYIAVEDKRFKVHNGIDYKGLARAGVALLKNGGEITQGGSTITQQVLKNGLLTQERTFKRKLIEFFLAPEFEKRYTKQEIMEFYVNMNFYGNNCYGIETASLYYFGKPSSQLTIAEAAMFVGMSNNASVYNPKNNYDLVKEKQIFVLGEMLEEGFISEYEYNKAINEPLNLIYDRESRLKEDYQTSYAIHSAILNLMEQDGFEFKYMFKNEEEYTKYKEKYSEIYNEIGTKIRSGGYSIYTSLDSDMQKVLQELIDRSLSKYTQKAEDGRYTFQGASVIVNNQTGYVEAIVGGRGTDDEFNRGFLAKRQPGSSIKPLVVYAPAFNSGLYYPSLIMNDKDDPDDKYYPKNYGGGFRGNMPIREALGRSINTIAYQIMMDIGANTGLGYLADMRFDTISYVDNNNTAVALGGFTYGVRVVDMAKGYSTLVNQGQYIDNNCILKIEYQNEGIIFEEDSERLPVFEADAAYMTVDCCRGVLEQYYGTAGHRQISNQIAMAKTGTTNDTKDAWFCGATEYYSMAVWVGYDTPKSTNLTGGTLPGQIWDEMMTTLHQDLDKVEFERPESVVNLYVDYNGKITKNNTGKTDLFSQTLLDKAEEERLAIIEQKKISIDNERISNIQEQIDALRVYVITDINSLDYLTKTFKRLSNLISEVYQPDKEINLSLQLGAIEDYFSVDIANMERYKTRQKLLEQGREEIDKEKELVKILNEFNNYSVKNISDIEKVESTYNSINLKIMELKDRQKAKYYYEKLDEIKGYKDILLKPYIKEQEAKAEEERQNLRNQIELQLTSIEALTEYYEGIEYIFYTFDDLISTAKNKGVETKEYVVRKEKIWDYISSLKPIEPNISENESNILENEENISENVTVESNENLELN